MIAYHHTLTVIDNDSPVQFALNKALQLAKKTNSKVTVLKIDRPYSNLLSKIGLIPNNALDPMLFVKKLLAKYQRQGVEVEIKSINNLKDHVALLNETQSGDYDLVIINNKHHNALLSEFIPRGEAHLLRDCDQPIMIVGNKSWQAHGHILTALETADSNTEHKELNQCLIDDSQQLASLLDNDIHLLNCYQLENWNMSVTKVNHQSSDEEQKKQHWDRLVNSAKNYHLADDHLHLEQGLPDHVIPAVANQCNANLLVIGAGEHHGLISELKGHTSSVLVDELKCDILAIKPHLH
ncbi:universal stress protein [Shewanella schlegeliana]|uniref:Universal stress protein n=1 Tax=Shewanella schlegeliana TaxID=190308 RepID=A0ABS1SUX2_9GAMM|nr:universal stress protein [Shewanella schlegeliana]MBL4912329.1 universal stress protein [Shewanella schlegeliana]MCL1108202.1 universal stress protein [Shewanella schlegeliana]GIU22176.1 universal stress protein E [Shewanella schlegeliana]